MSFEETDVGCLGKRLSEIFHDQGLGDATFSAPVDKEASKTTESQLETEPKYGDCYIFDYQKFLMGKDFDRPGSEKDVQRLKHDFTKLNFNVYSDHLNLTIQKTLDALEAAAKKDYTQSKCFVCCFLTHGDNGELAMHDGYVDINDILKLFSRSACKSLAGKPKIFIFQACRGHSCEEGVEIYDSTDGGSTLSLKKDIPDYLDFLLVYATYENYMSFKTKNEDNPEHNHGSFFIDELCRTIEQFSDQLDFLQILTLVNYRIGHFFLSHTLKKSTDKKKQMPGFRSRLTEEVKFKRKIPMFVTDDTKYFEQRRKTSSLGLKSTQSPLEDRQIYKIQNSNRIHFLSLLNSKSQFGCNWTQSATSLWESIASRGYKRDELKDWSKKYLKAYLEKVADAATSTDCLICFVACQGEGDDLYDKNGRRFRKREVVEQFTGKACSCLRGKPKIFIFLTSSFTKKSSFPSVSADSSDGPDYYNMIPVHADLLQIAITIQESRQLDGVIGKLCNIFEKKSSEDFLSQLTRMNGELVKEYGFHSPSNEDFATFYFDSTLTETLILNKPKAKGT